MSAPRYTVDQVDAVLAHLGSSRVAAAELGINRNTVAAWRRGAFPDVYRAAKGIAAAPQATRPAARTPPARPGRSGSPGYTVAQIDRALACATHKAAAAALGIPEHRVAAWRTGDLPRYYREAKRAAKPVAAAQAVRFVRPQDARAGR